MKDVPVRSVKKALDLLSILIFDDAELKGMKLTELAQRLGLPANTTHNLLKTMSVCGYVSQNDSGRYRPGPQCRRIVLLNKVEGPEFRQKLSDVLKRHTYQINEAMVFAVLHGGKRVLIASSEPVSQVIRVDRQSVESGNFWRLPTGRVLAAFASPEDFKLIIGNYGSPDRIWPESETGLKRILREKRCVMLPDHSGLNSFAIPVTGANDRLLGAIGCYAPPFRCGPQVRQKILEHLRLAADELAQG